MAELLLLTALVVVVILVFSGTASAYPAANDTQYRSWALRWHKQEVTQDAKYQRMRVALGMKKTQKLTKIAWHTAVLNDPSTGVEIETMSWRQYGAACKRRAVHIRDYSKPKLWKRLTHPKGSGASRWWPLARYVGWPSPQRSTLLAIIWRESNGNPNAVNRSSGCAGLLQIHPCHGVTNVTDPAVNLRAGLRLWRSQGWYPWRLY
jgi:soluble lytic murein transglycosylase-like protein